MNRETALRKVLQCLRLAGSSNPHEAAAALRQARALMDKFGLTEDDAYASEIHHADAPTRCRGTNPPVSLTILINIVGRGFRCDVVVMRSPGWTTEVRFFGAGSDAQVAAYAFTVLRRQMEADKAKHTARIRKRAHKEARGERFALGWVSAVARLFPEAELSGERRAAIDAAVNALGQLQKVDGRAIGKQSAASSRDSDAGYYAGSRARVNPGIGESGQRKLEHST